LNAAHPLGALAPLAAIPRWIVARRADKVPLDRAGHPASALDPANWRTYDGATAEVARMGAGFGLGFVLVRGGGVTVIDIDKCRMPDGTWSALAQELCASLPGAVGEMSQSGNGLHIWCRHPAPPEHACKRTDLRIEAYSADRFILLGHPGTTGVLADQCDALPAVLARHFPPHAEAADDLPEDGPVPEWQGQPETEASNADLIAEALASRSASAVFGGGASFADLWHADTAALARAYPASSDRPDGCAFDRSSADAALFAHLAYWCGKDAARMVRLAQRSALKRDKWDRADYIRRTVHRACKLTAEVRGQRQPVNTTSTPPQAPAGPLVAAAPTVQGVGAPPLLPMPPAAVPPFVRVPVADIATAPPEPQAWWVADYLPAGHVTLLGGHGGAGKSTLALVAAACIAAGLPFLRLPTRAGRVLYFSAEDPGALVRRRLARVCRVLGVEPVALADRLQILDATDGDPTLYADARGHGARAGSLTATFGALRQHVEAELVDVLIVDNASDTFDADEINRAAVRAFVRSLAQLVRHRDGAVLLLAHVDKSTSRAGRAASAESYSGSTAWHNSVRSRLFLVETSPGLLELQHQKSNLGPRREPVTLMWPRDGLPTLIDSPHAPSAADADMRALLALIAEFTGRGEHLSTSEQGRPSLTKALSGERSYPRHLSHSEVFAILRDAERRQLLTRESFKKDRKDRERFAISAAGRDFLASAPSAPSV